MKLAKLLTVGAGLLLGVCVQARSADKVDFAKQIEPIFSQTCFKCHAGAKHKGSLKLDSLEAIRKGGKDAKDKVVVAGQPDKSDLYHRISLPEDDDDVMPPSDKAKHLTKEQVGLIKEWIAQGAEFGAWKESKVTASADGKPDSSTTQAAAPADTDGPKEIVLPTVAAGDAGAIEKLRQAGALCLPLAQGTNLLSVEFTSNANQITDQQLALLDPLAAQVYDLNLANTKVTDNGLKSLEGMKNLHRLHLEKTPITDGGLVHLKGLTGLEYLNLYNTAVTDAGLTQLDGLKSLKNVYLWQSKVTESGAKDLKKALPQVAVDMGWKEPGK
ncbi:MAG TPA: c-type cytochrome domain-containing protein [Tepidisphaeraceae bacterium]|nr:c-type cytochrome domain-containing protein [Tepidisphaeraceae bacterium]